MYYLLAGLVVGGGVLVFVAVARYGERLQTIIEVAAAYRFACDVNKRLAERQGAQLLVSYDEWGGTHYDIVPTHSLATENLRVQIFHTQHLPLDQQPTDPQSIVYHAYSHDKLHTGSFARYPTPSTPIVRVARPTVKLPAISDEDGEIA